MLMILFLSLRVALQDFSKLREAHLERLASSARRQRTNLSASFSTLAGNMLQPQPLTSALATAYPAIGGGMLGVQSRGFFTGAITNRLQDLRLKQLERIANMEPTNPSAQYDFLSELAQRYPEAVVERFEQFPDLAVDDRCALLYFSSLQRINGQARFNLPAFVKRMQMGGGPSTRSRCRPCRTSWRPSRPRARR